MFNSTNICEPAALPSETTGFCEDVRMNDLCLGLEQGASNSSNLRKKYEQSYWKTPTSTISIGKIPYIK